MGNINEIWDSELVELKAIEKACLMKKLGPEKGLALFEEMNNEDTELPEDYDKIDFDAIDAEDDDDFDIDEDDYVLVE